MMLVLTFVNGVAVTWLLGAVKNLCLLYPFQLAVGYNLVSLLLP